MKTCKGCGAAKPACEFYVHSKNADGLTGKCKPCTKAQVRDYRQRNLAKVMEYDRNRPNANERAEAVKLKSKTLTAQQRARLAEGKRAWAAANLEKRACHVIAGNAIRDGRLIKRPCEVCGADEVDAHHDDYAKPLGVRWLCRKHHAEHHKRERAKQRRLAKQ
jgi:hypothetical protein